MDSKEYSDVFKVLQGLEQSFEYKPDTCVSVFCLLVWFAFFGRGMGKLWFYPGFNTTLREDDFGKLNFLISEGLRHFSLPLSYI